MSSCIGLRSLHLLYEDQDKYEYDIVLANIARAIGTILWILLLLTPLVQVNIYNVMLY